MACAPWLTKDFRSQGAWEFGVCAYTDEMPPSVRGVAWSWGRGRSSRAGLCALEGAGFTRELTPEVGVPESRCAHADHASDLGQFALVLRGGVPLERAPELRAPQHRLWDHLPRLAGSPLSGSVYNRWPTLANTDQSMRCMASMGEQVATGFPGLGSWTDAAGRPARAEKSTAAYSRDALCAEAAASAAALLSGASG